MATPRSKGKQKSVNSALVDAIKNVVSAANQTSRLRNSTQLDLDLRTIEATATDSGLPAECFAKIINVAASKKFSEAVSGKLIKSLIPATVVPEDAVVKAISWMCTNTPSVNTQALLLRWINLVFDSIDGKDKLHALYGILFYFLDSETLMPHVCHLLYQLTQREDVRMFRVRHLLTLQVAAGPQPFLLGLLSLYKLFYPNLVTISIPRQQRMFFRQTDRAWAAAIRRVKEKNRSLEEVPVDMDTTRLNQSLSASFRATKRARLEIPAVSTSTDVDAKHDSRTVHTSLDRVPMPFSHVKDFTELVENMERVEMPGQIAAVLQNPLLQHVVSCQQSQTTAARFSMWLQHALLEEFIISPDVTEKKQKEQLFNLLIKYSSFLQEGIPACERFLERYLASWNGLDFKRHIFELIAMYRMCPFGRLKVIILDPLHCLFFSSTIYFKCQVLLSLAELLSNFMTVEWKRSLSFTDVEGEEEAEQRKSMCLFEEEREHFLPRETIQRLVEFVDRMCCVGLLAEPGNALLTHFILTFYERASKLHQYGVPLICLPSRTIVYNLLLGSSAVSVSRLCSLLCSYKAGFTFLRNYCREHDLAAEDVGLGQIVQLNCYITDLASSLWQYKSFQNPQPMSLFNLDPDIVQSLALSHPSECLSIHSHQALVGLAVRFLEETQPEGTVVHPNSIKASFNTKQMYLRYLQTVDVQGIVDFIVTFVRKKARATSNRTGDITY